MKRVLGFLLGVVVSTVLIGCGEKEPQVQEQAQAQPPPLPSSGAIDVAAEHKPSAPPPTGLPPGVYPSVANVQAAAPVSPSGPLDTLVPKGDIFFFDDDGNFLPKDGVDFLQRAVRSYTSTQKYKSDDSPDWPPLTDLQLLVQYKVIKMIPSAPAGQKFVIDPKTRVVSLASN